MVEVNRQGMGFARISMLRELRAGMDTLIKRRVDTGIILMGTLLMGMAITITMMRASIRRPDRRRLRRPSTTPMQSTSTALMPLLFHEWPWSWNSLS